MTTPLHSPPLASPTLAVVHAGHRATSYARAGAGAPVVLLLPAGDAGGSGPALFDRLAATCRVVAPVCPDPLALDEPFAVWLRAFLDGLGLPAVRLVAGDTFGVAALAFALIERERVERVVLIHADLADAECGDSSVRERLEASGLPVLVVRADRTGADRTASASAVATRIHAFLTGAPGDVGDGRERVSDVQAGS